MQYPWLNDLPLHHFTHFQFTSFVIQYKPNDAAQYIYTNICILIYSPMNAANSRQQNVYLHFIRWTEYVFRFVVSIDSEIEDETWTCIFFILYCTWINKATMATAHFLLLNVWNTICWFCVNSGFYRWRKPRNRFNVWHAKNESIAQHERFHICNGMVYRMGQLIDERWDTFRVYHRNTLRLAHIST